MFKKILDCFNSRGSESPFANVPEVQEPENPADDLERLDCPSCGGPLEIGFIGPCDADKVAHCPYCQRTVDLPDAADGHSRLRTRERVIERPNEKILERVSEWTQRSSTTLDLSEEWKDRLGEIGSGLLRDKWKSLPFGQLDTGGSCQEWRINGKEFTSRDEMLAHVRESFPAEMADRVLELIDRPQG